MRFAKLCGYEMGMIVVGVVNELGGESMSLAQALGFDDFGIVKKEGGRKHWAGV